MLNMLVVEDDMYFSKLLINKTIQSNKDLRLCMIATDGKEAIDIIKKEKIDIILLDLNLPKCNGLEILDFLDKYQKEEYIKSIIVISCREDMIRETINNPLVYCYISKIQGMNAIVEKVNNISKEKEDALNDKKQMQKRRKIVKKKIKKELIDLGYNSKYIGTDYLSDSIYYIYLIKDKKRIKLEKDIYPLIAEKNHTTVNTVKCDIIRATSHLKDDIEQLKLKEYFGYFLDRKIKPKLVITAVLNKIKQEI